MGFHRHVNITSQPPPHVLVPEIDMIYVHSGPALAPDITLLDLIADGNWHTLALSPKLPQAAVLAHLHIVYASFSNGIALHFAKPGADPGYNHSTHRIHTTNDPHSDDIIIPPTNAQIQYLLNPGLWQMVAITIAGWFI